MNDLLGLDELNRRVLERGLCAACGACVSRCPYLVKFRGKTVKLDSCTVEQGRCYAYCPMTFFDENAVSQSLFGEPYDANGLGRVIAVAAARSSFGEIQSVAQGGGAVTSLVITALEEGIADAAVLTTSEGTDGYLKGIVVTDKDEVKRAAGSKFVGAHSLEALREALDRGYQRIAIVGLPCQVKALRKMALLDLKQENLANRISMVIGLFCNWALSIRDLLPFLSERIGPGKIKKYDIPPPPAKILKVFTEEETIDIPLDDIRSITQESCKLCDDMTSEFADISVGMYEGKVGWNTLLTRTDAGRTLVRLAAEKGSLELSPFPEENLAHLRSASLQKKERARAAVSLDIDSVP
ncbi:MAG: Coenzyme F420 hydrogenase/dehydrogenase, beta subunit C-terminal domain [Desulfomonile tiedjei]|uniref:Coenzyme F420 hydrogenase/dehydrogenase, beta subunit C-terminal domain n=1 Tax=Desulfomonile tiedjei TaxID=2358 RepID=A0A9D6V312_9BACT|nr:Coenzyme F420 hydrogenase/dehydrogenase, beta subunit C-terminal domain [Desulfomonile tiedjei]